MWPQGKWRECDNLGVFLKVELDELADGLMSSRQTVWSLAERLGLWSYEVIDDHERLPWE